MQLHQSISYRKTHRRPNNLNQAINEQHNKNSSQLVSVCTRVVIELGVYPQKLACTPNLKSKGYMYPQFQNGVGMLRSTGQHKILTWELSGRVLNSRPKGCGYEPHHCHCVVFLSKNINPSLVAWFAVYSTTLSQLLRMRIMATPYIFI